MNEGLRKRIQVQIADIKHELAEKKAEQPDSELTQEQIDKMLDVLGVLTELLQQFE